MKDRTELEALFQKHGYRDFKWLDPGEVVVSQWVRTKRNAPLGFMQAEADSGIRPQLFLKTSLTSHPPAYIVYTFNTIRWQEVNYVHPADHPD